MEISLKYGCNPNQAHARVVSHDASPLTLVNGAPSYINVLDALRGWQLVRDLRAAVRKPAAASFKHVSPAGAAVAGPLSDDFRRAHFYNLDDDLSPVAAAYAKARSSDRVASFGDFVAVSEPVDITLASLLKLEVSDGIIAPDYDDDALAVLKTKKGGKYVILQMDPLYEPPAVESRTEFGLTLEQDHNDLLPDPSMFANVATQNKTIPDDVIETMLVATITLKHTQSNSVAIGYQGQAVGIGAGQQSRIACTRLCCEKTERFLLKQHPKALNLKFHDGMKRSDMVNLMDMFVRYDELWGDEANHLKDMIEGGRGVEAITPDERKAWLMGFDGLVCSSDAFFPFRDNIDRVARSGVKYVVQAGGSARDEEVIAAADEHGIAMAMSGVRLFLH